MFATGMTCSHEQLVMDEEISALSQRLARGVAVTEETIARELIEAIGPQGPTYLTTDHTLHWLRSDEYHLPGVAVRGPFASWRAAGAPDTTTLAREQARQHAAQPVPELDDARRRQIAEIIAGFGG
jgi:trimethylamine---corrinoid protein Co-methyltransferase